MQCVVMTKSDDILVVLDDLLKLDDVLACMLAKKGLGGIVPKGIKINNPDLWKTISLTTNDLFGLIDKFFVFGIGRLYFELGEYTVVMAPISQESALIVIIPSLANLGLLEVEVENSKRQIKTIVYKKEFE